MVTKLLDLANADTRDEWLETDFFEEEATLLFLPMLETNETFEERALVCR